MSGVAILPDDLLSEILLLATRNSIVDKFAVAQVSCRWRAVALGAPLLWSSLNLSKTAHFFYLPALLERSCLCPLDIDLSPASPGTLDLAAMQALALHAPRIRGISVDVHDSMDQETLSPFLAGDLQFPNLERLYLSAGVDNVRIASAPALRVLSLSFVHVDTNVIWRVVGPKLETLDLVVCTPLSSSELLPLIKRCPNLRRLVFRESTFAVPTLAGCATVSNGPELQVIEFLDVTLPCAEMFQLIAGSSPAAREMNANVTGRLLHPVDIALLCDALLRGIDTLVTFDHGVNHNYLGLRDVVGRARNISEPQGSGTPFYIREIWTDLTTRNVRCESVRRFGFPTSEWDEVVDALAEHPLQLTEGIHLRIALNLVQEIGDREFPPTFPECRDLFVGGLDCVELLRISPNRDYTLNLADIASYILQRLRPGHSRTIRVLLKAVAPELDGNERQEYRTSVRRRVAQETRGNWDICFE